MDYGLNIIWEGIRGPIGRVVADKWVQIILGFASRVKILQLVSCRFKTFMAYIAVCFLISKCYQLRVRKGSRSLKDVGLQIVHPVSRGSPEIFMYSNPFPFSQLKPFKRHPFKLRH